MDFEYFLDTAEVEIIKIVEQAGYAIEENTVPCLVSNEYVGNLKEQGIVWLGLQEI